MTECPGRRRSRRNCHTHSKPDPCEAALDIVDEPMLAAEQMRDSGHVEPQPLRPIDFDERRPAAGPVREPLKQGRVTLRVGRNRDQCRIERARVGQPRAGRSSALGRGLGDGMDDQSVRPLDGKDDGRVRR